MIHIRIVSSGERITAVELTGHGGEARGRDIICAAVSAVAETALAGLLHYGRNQVHWHMDEGFLSIRVGNVEQGDRRELLNAILTTMVIGLREIAREHPRKIRIELEQDPGISDKA